MKKANVFHGNDHETKVCLDEVNCEKEKIVSICLFFLNKVAHGPGQLVLLVLGQIWALRFSTWVELGSKIWAPLIFGSV